MFWSLICYEQGLCRRDDTDAGNLAMSIRTNWAMLIMQKAILTHNRVDFEALAPYRGLRVPFWDHHLCASSGP